jgi:enamine deaminase RidA (YjgF/YER057c/UK114 family)
MLSLANFHTANFVPHGHRLYRLMVMTRAPQAEYMNVTSPGEGLVTINRIDVGARLSKVVIHGDTVYLAGLTADKTAGQSVGAQTQEILAAIDGLLAKAGTDKSKLLQATIWLQDIRTVDEMNKVWDAWVPQGCAPARACIEARLQSPAKMVEIRVTAAR